jgi:hypothetical protein
MTANPTPRRLSASRVKLLNDCSWRFYASEYLLWPEKIWPRTHVGTIVHSVLECLYRRKHWGVYDIIKEANTITAAPSVMRLVRAWQYKTKVDDTLIADVDPMVMLVLNHTNFRDEGAVRRFEPEHEFTMTLRNGGKVRGYIDRLVAYSSGWVVWDYKSQKTRFTEDETFDNFQSLVYQWYIWKTYGELASVNYVMLRHPPTSRTPNKHIQTTPPATPAQLEGFERYLEYLYETINSFTEEDGKAAMKTDDEGFCRNVCSYYTPKVYLSIKKRGTNALVGNYLPEFAPALKEDEYVEELRHGGCPRFNP